MGLKSCPSGHMSGPATRFCRECGHAFKLKGGTSNHLTVAAAPPPAIVRSAEVPRPKVNVVIPKPNFEASPFSDINFNPLHHFDKMVEREAQVYRVCAAIRSAVESGFETTNHLLFWGPSSAGKTSFMNATEKMVGKSNCLRIDAKTATMAGVIDEIKVRRQGIKFLLVDELEKNLKAFGWLLNVMEDHWFQQMQSANVGDGLTEFEFSPLVMATVNDVERLKNFESGAFYYRMTNKVYFPPISDGALFGVLKPYLARMKGKDEWIPKVIEYVRGAKGGDDIREMKAALTDGRELWDDGSYADILRMTNSPD